jgi:hypothetical protein
MGLLFQLPVEENQLDDRVSIVSKAGQTKLILKSYGLPWIFWGYLLASLSVVFFLGLAGMAPLGKLLASDDPLNQVLALTVWATLILIPFGALSFYFYEKVITKMQSSLVITHRVFWIPVRTNRLELKAADAFELEHFMDSPNIAKIKGEESMRGFENRGHYELFALTKDGQRQIVDRNSRPSELKKLASFLSRY